MTARLRVLDTDTLSLVQRNQQSYVQRLLALPPDQRAITIVTVEEQLRGWLAHIRRAKDMTALIRTYAHLYEAIMYLTQINILVFDNQAATIMNQLRQQKIRIGTLDLRIAAIVLAKDGILITRNLAHFQQVPGLAIEDWS
jgi:tRNA(fMet)-specific endonuclease VapC